MTVGVATRATPGEADAQGATVTSDALTRPALQPARAQDLTKQS